MPQNDYFVQSTSVEYSEDPGELFFESLGLSADTPGLEGWGFLKKVWKGVKKVVKKGKKVFRKLKISKLLKVAIPVAGIIGLPFLGPLVGVSAAKLAKKFGPKVARLIKLGRTKPAFIRVGRKVLTALVTPQEHQKILQVTKGNASAPIPDVYFTRITGRTVADSEIPGATFSGGKVQIPVYNSPELVTGTDSELPPEPPAGTTGGMNWAIPAALAAVVLLKK